MIKEEQSFIEENLLNKVDEYVVVNDYPYLELIMNNEHSRASIITSEIIEKTIIDNKDNLLEATRILVPIIVSIIKLTSKHTVFQRSDIRVALNVIDSIEKQIIDEVNGKIDIESLVKYIIQYDKKITTIAGVMNTKIQQQSWRSLFSNFLALLFVIIDHELKNGDRNVKGYFETL